VQVSDADQPRLPGSDHWSRGGRRSD
jgi:hypothetical protein